MKLVLVLGVVAVLAAPALSEELTHAVSLSPRSATALGRVHVPRFDASLGWLSEVRVELDLQVEGALGYENLADVHNEVRMTLAAACAVETLGGAQLVTAYAEATAMQIAAPFDGQVDLAGPSGFSADGIVAKGATGRAIVGDPSWTDLVAANGPVVLLLRTADLTSVVGTESLVARHGQRVSVAIEVTYVYTPWDQTAD